MTIEDLYHLRESEDKIEFKAATRNFPFNGGSHREQEERRKCFLGYIVAFANERGGMLVLGMGDKIPHEVVGTDFSLGKTGNLEDEVYSRLGIQIKTEELYSSAGLRVLITHIPSRPVAKMLKFEGVPLMRTGESLRNMSDEEMFAILSEQEPDFSATFCHGLRLSDLDDSAIQKMIQSYASKQRNSNFLQLSKEQVLIDLKLLSNDQLNYAALILLGKQEAIQKYLPQSKIIWEYRNSEAQIHFDGREIIDTPLFLAIDKVWALINQPSLNRKHPIQSGAYIFDIYDFNEVVIREAMLNAIAHRDYKITSEVVIKQYPTQIVINNPGGFPKGVTIENLLTISSTPRSRLMTEILEKTGLVERSGQGVDKIFSLTLSEGKSEPDYSKSDLFQVVLVLRSEILDKAFHSFITQYQNGNREPKLGVEQIIILCKIRNGIFQHLKGEIVTQLERAGLIQRASGHSTRYTLTEEYFQLVNNDLKIGKRYLVREIENLLLELQDTSLKIGELESRLALSVNRNQIKYLILKLTEDEIITHEGIGKGTKYLLASEYAHLRGDVLLSKVIHTLRERHQDIVITEYVKPTK